MPRHDDERIVMDSLAGHLADTSIRDLFTRFCREIEILSDSIAIETTPFEVRFYDPAGFRVRVSPYRELFLVSIGSSNPCDVRVSGEDGFVSALDLAIKSFLDARVRAAGIDE